MMYTSEYTVQNRTYSCGYAVLTNAKLYNTYISVRAIYIIMYYTKGFNILLFSAGVWFDSNNNNNKR